MIEKLKIAAYLEDAGDDPASSCKTLQEVGISNAVIRHIWTSNIKDLTDSGCVKLRKILDHHQIKPAAIYSTIANIPVNKLQDIPIEALDRTFSLAAYFKSPIIIFNCGDKIKTGGDYSKAIFYWLQEIQDRSLAANILPLIEITTNSHIMNASELITMLTRFSRPKLLYDPVQLIIKQNIDPFVKYWTLWKQHIAAIDVRDYKIGHGYKPFGYGDAQIVRTVADAIRSDFNGWYFFEPSLGKRHGTANTKSEVFKSAYGVFSDVVNGWKHDQI